MFWKNIGPYMKDGFECQQTLALDQCNFTEIDAPSLSAILTRTVIAAWKKKKKRLSL